MAQPTRLAVTALTALAVVAGLGAQGTALPSARLVEAPRLVVPDDVDSNMPMTWDLVDGTPRLFALASWGGVPSLLAGRDLDRLRRVTNSVEFVPHPGYGIWIETVIADDEDTWYGYYHHEVPADVCGRPDRAIPRIGAAISENHGKTWRDLGPVLEAPPSSYACSSTNRFILGGVGDLSAMLDEEKQNLYLFFSQYSKPRTAQGVSVARLAWTDRDNPTGAFAVWQHGAWIPPREVFDDEDSAPRWEYPAGTALVEVMRPWHDGDPLTDAFWGPSIHWNTYLEQYVMLLNRARNENFDNEGIYIAYARTLNDPSAWSAPKKLMSGGGWYPQVVGLDVGSGTDKLAGQRARFFLTGKSDQMIEFSR